MTFKGEQEEFPPVSERDEYMQLYAFISVQILKVGRHGHLIFLFLSRQKQKGKF